MCEGAVFSPIGRRRSQEQHTDIVAKDKQYSLEGAPL
jgi:hypothetical protein